jgi:hypothetical protein
VCIPFGRYAVVAVCLVILSGVWSSGFGDVVRDRIGVLFPDGQSRQLGSSPDDSVTLPYLAAVPDTLPTGLVNQGTVTGPGGRQQTLYCNEAGWCIQLLQEKAESGVPDLGGLAYEGRQIEGTMVWLGQFGDNPELFNAMVWERGGIEFRIAVVASPHPYAAAYSRDDAIAIVEAVMNAQDSR